MTDLLAKKCIPCSGDEPPLNDEQVQEYLKQVPDWELKEVDGVPRIQRTFKFDDFITALNFTQALGELAEQQGHHPVLVTTWGKVTVKWWTHKIKGLHQNDFIMAAKSDHLYESS